MYRITIEQESVKQDATASILTLNAVYQQTFGELDIAALITFLNAPPKRKHRKLVTKQEAE